MNQPPSERFQELAAGYVLGNLDAEELQEFQALSQTYPEEELLTAKLQQILSQLPYSLLEHQPPTQVSDRIVTKAQSPTLKRSRSVWIAGLMTLTTLGLGIDNIRVRYQLAQVESPPLQIVTSPQVLKANWGGITQVLEDYTRAQRRGSQAVEIKAREQNELFEILQQQDLTLPATPPNLSAADFQLLGGAICKFDKTIGIRVMYETPDKKPISLYQLHRAKTPNFPRVLKDPVVIQHDAGPNLLLWGDEEFLFAIVADLSRQDLSNLTQDLKYSEI